MPEGSRSDAARGAPWAALATVFLVALSVRLLFLLSIEAYPKFELIRNRLDDQVTFDSWAKHLASGRAFDYTTTAHEFAYWAAAAPEVFPQAPLYPYLLGAFYRLFGTSYDGFRLAQMIAGAAACAGLFLVGRLLLAPYAAWFAGLALALWGPLVFYDATFLRASVLTGVVVATLGLALAASRARHTRSVWWTAALGLACGAGTLLRPSYLLVAVAVVVWLASVIWRRGERRRALQLAAVMLGALSVTLAPVVVRNSLAAGKPVLISSNGPYILYIGNVHDATGTGVYHSPTYERMKAGAAGPGDVDLARELLADVAAHPGDFARLQLRKAAAFVSPIEIPNNLSYEMGRRLVPALRFAFAELWMVLPLAAVGLVAALRLRGPWMLPLGVGLAYSIASILFYVMARIRLPVVPVILLLAGLGVEVLWSALRGSAGGRRRLALALVAGVVGATLLLARYRAPLRITDFFMAAAAQQSRGELFEERLQLAEARRSYTEAVVLNPQHADALAACRRLRPQAAPSTPALAPAEQALLDQGIAAAEASRLEAARRALRRLAVLRPDVAVVQRMLANLDFLEGDLGAAERRLAVVLRADPEDAVARSNLVRVRQRLYGAVDQGR